MPEIPLKSPHRASVKERQDGFEEPGSNRRLQFTAEVSVALAGTVFSAVLLVLAAIHAGGLWRDETNTINLALMPSLRALWHNSRFESFPPLWPLILRGCGFLGLVHSDFSIRLLGLCVGFLFLASLWLCCRWTGNRAPILSVALLGSLPAFVLVVGANRAYGLACCLLVLTFGLIWRSLEVPSRSNILWAAFVCLLFAQCVYYDVVFLCAMLAGGALVTIRRRAWKTLWVLVGIGLTSAVSVTIYLPIIHESSRYVLMVQNPLFHDLEIWYGLRRTLESWSIAAPGRPHGPEIWIFIGLLVIGSVGAVAPKWEGGRRGEHREGGQSVAARVPSDLALYCFVSLSCGVVGLFVFLATLRFFMQPWYFLEILVLCAVSLDGLLGKSWPDLRPWGFLRIGLMVVLMTLSAKSAWEQSRTRHTNVDLVASFLNREAVVGDLIVLQDPWEGITFHRYYNGPVPWVTVPPIDSHEVQRNDLVLERMSQPDAMAPVLSEIARVLRRGKSIWVVGNMPIVRPRSLPPLPPPPPPALPTKWWMAPYFYCWNTQVSIALLNHAVEEQNQPILVNGPVNPLENASVKRFSGYRSDGD
jgi:hypothetical protein